MIDLKSKVAEMVYTHVYIVTLDEEKTKRRGKYIFFSDSDGMISRGMIARYLTDKLGFSVYTEDIDDWECYLINSQLAQFVI